MAAEASRSGASADSYIGSLISLTSKCEIRYEGVLYNINTEESSIGLRDVRSFGTEGRKKDGAQIPASDKIYEYILFRGSDIKDLQVKSSPPVQTAPIHNDPAIIQSHYSRPTYAPTSLPSVGSGTVADLNSHTAQLGLPRSTFQGGLPLPQSGGSLGSWVSSPTPPTQNGSGLAMPLYWQGYYTPSGGLPHLQQPPLFRPPPGVPIPHSMQHFQYPGVSASLPSGSPNLLEFPSPLSQPVGSTLNFISTTLPLTLAPSQASSSAPDMTTSLPYKPPVTCFPAATLGANLSTVPPLTSSLGSIATLSQNRPSVVSDKPSTVPGPTMAYQITPQSMSSIVGSSNPSQVETSAPLVTPGQLMQPGLSTLPSSQPFQARLKAVEVKPPESRIKSSLPEPSEVAPSEAKEPILPLPMHTDQKPNGAALQTHYGGRGRGRGNGPNGAALQTHHGGRGRVRGNEPNGAPLQTHHSGRGRGRGNGPNGAPLQTHHSGRGRGRGNGHPRPVTKFMEDFDFTAMNEKFKKDEVWGHLGKSKVQLRDREGEDKEADDTLEDDDSESLKLETTPVYVKEDFFDSLSSNTLDHGTRNGRSRFSEQLKIDTQTFGDFQRHRPSRGGGRGFHGGRTRGSYYGRGYGYIGRGRGHMVGT